MTGPKKPGGLSDLMGKMARSGSALPAQEAAPERQVVLPAPERPVMPPVARERRAAWGARLLPSLHQFVKAEAVAMSGEAGQHISMEDVVEALIREMQTDADLRARVFQRAARD